VRHFLNGSLRCNCAKCRIARDHDREERIEDLNNDEKKKEEESRKAKEHDKVIEELKNALRKLTSSQLEEEEEKIREEIAQLRAQLEELNPDKEDEEKQEKSASLEYLGVDSYHSVGKDGDSAIEDLQTLQRQRNRKKKSIQSQTYSVLTLLDQNHNTASGDSLIQRMGSVD